MIQLLDDLHRKYFDAQMLSRRGLQVQKRADGGLARSAHDPGLLIGFLGSREMRCKSRGKPALGHDPTSACTRGYQHDLDAPRRAAIRERAILSCPAPKSQTVNQLLHRPLPFRARRKIRG